MTYSYDTNPYSSTYSQYTTGRLTATQYNASPASGGQWITEMYSYHPAGAVTGKSLQVGSSTTNTMSVSYAYNSAGQVYTMQYPASTSATLTYGYDSMARPNSLTSQVTGYNAQTLVPATQYDLAGRMSSMQYLATTTSGSCGAVSIYTQETMSYNTNGQLASLNWGNGSSSGCTAQYIDNGPVGGITYNYSSTQNNGQITQAVDTLSGETISYAYDGLKRLTSASSTPISGSTPTAWTETFQYDGFGNLTAKVLNGTSTPIAVNAATNQLTYASYDSNGNMTSGVGATLAYDVSNRMVSAAETSGGIEYYGYAPDNKRVFRQLANGTQQVTLYGAKGEKLAIATILSQHSMSAAGAAVWFGGKLIADQNGPVYSDRLGTNRASGTGVTTTYNATYGTTNTGARFLPFGDEITSTANDHVKFGTYTRDSYTGLDYADQRFYASSYGRFNTPDPYKASGGPKDPGSWNRYSYAGGDPVGRHDPGGLMATLTCNTSEDGDDISIEDCVDYIPDECLLIDGVLSPICGNSNAFSTQGGGGGGIIRVANLTTTSVQAQAVQNSLRWIGAQIGSFPTCDNWLGGNDNVTNTINTLLGQTSTVDTDSVGVGNFSNPDVNAVYGTAGTNLPTDGSALLTINLNGAYFNPNASMGTGVVGINAGSSQAQSFILLHELAHATNAPGFQDGDNVPAIQGPNNQLLMQNCSGFIRSVSN